jgi:hypothetical protein
MSNTLVKRYTFGNLHIAPSSQEGYLLYGISARQRELVSLAKSQVEAQKEAARNIMSSHFQAAQMISREVENQTRDLERSVGQMSDEISSALDYLGDRVCGDLSEIRWELAQLRAASEQILQVLKRPRSTEAQELIRQGVRHLVNNEIVEAEDRLRKALERDTTDYQVLMNLSYIALHNNNADEAIVFTNKALTLPENLDVDAKAHALWSLARIYYTLEQFSQSYSLARKAIDIVSNSKRIYQTGVYALLSGSKGEGIALIRQAILQDSAFFAVAATDPDLNSSKNDILALLAALSAEIQKQASDSWQMLGDTLKSTSKTSSSDYVDLLSHVPSVVDKVKLILGAPSYSTLAAAINVITSLQQTLTEFSALSARNANGSLLSDKMASLKEAISSATTDYSKKQKHHQAIQKRLDKKMTSERGKGGVILFIISALFFLGWALMGFRRDYWDVIIFLIVIWGIYIFWQVMKTISKERVSREVKDLENEIGNCVNRRNSLENESQQAANEFHRNSQDIEDSRNRIGSKLTSIEGTISSLIERHNIKMP